MTESRAKELLARAGAVLYGHYVGTSGNHMSVYVAKDRATRFTTIVSELCQSLAKRFAGENIDVVVAPAVGGIALSQWTAYHLTLLRPDRAEVEALYSEHEEEVLSRAERDETFDIQFSSGFGMGQRNFRQGEELIIKKPTFLLKRGFAVDVSGRRVLEVEDILTTGGSARRTADAIRSAGGELIGLGVLANGGHVTPEACGVKCLEALVQIERELYTELSCAQHGLCAKGIPVNTNFGHGKAFLARQAQDQGG